MCPQVGTDLNYVQWQQYSQAKVFLCVGGWGPFYGLQTILWWKGMETPVGWAHPPAQNMANISRAVQERMHPSREVAILNLVPGGWEA